MNRRATASTIVFGLLTGILLVFLLFALTGCVTEVTRESTKYRFMDGITYKEQKFYILPAQNENDRWKYAASKNAPDDGIAKVMNVDLQQQWSDEYHNEHPECSYSYYR